MSDLAGAIAAWHAVEHVSELTGLSLGMLAALVALSIYVPLLRSFAITAALTVAVGYCSGMYFYGLGRSDVRKEWEAADAAAEKAAKARDANVAAELERKYRPQLDALNKRAATEKARADESESRIVGMLAKDSPRPGDCRLGSSALRLRRLH